MKSTCLAISRNEYVCTLDKDHGGNHAAFGIYSLEPLFEWENAAHQEDVLNESLSISEQNADETFVYRQAVVMEELVDIE